VEPLEVGWVVDHLDPGAGGEVVAPVGYVVGDGAVILNGAGALGDGVQVVHDGAAEGAGEAAVAIERVLRLQLLEQAKKVSQLLFLGGLAQQPQQGLPGGGVG